mgnify:CR=1 FL=1
MYRYSCSLLLCLLTAILAFGQPPERDPAREAALHEELRAIAPKVVDAFAAATNELDAGNFAEADRLYGDVLAKAPDFDAALRRRGYALVALGKRKEGLDLTQKAYQSSARWTTLSAEPRR